MSNYKKPHLRPQDLGEYKEVTPFFTMDDNSLFGFTYSIRYEDGNTYDSCVTRRSNEWLFRRLLRFYFPTLWGKAYPNDIYYTSTSLTK